MFTPPKPSIVLSNLNFSWPNGDLVFKEINASFTTGSTGLIGDNGSGKSTLLRLMTGLLPTPKGTITTTGTVGYLPQHLTLQTDSTVANLLGISQKIAALSAIESGDASLDNFEILDDDWEVESSARASLDRLGLVDVELSRSVGTLSGGESILVALLGLINSDHEIILLDEPTNNLDYESRQRLYQLIKTWNRTLIVVSHDVELLNLMERTAELHGQALNLFGGNFAEYQEYLETQQMAAEQALQSAEQQLKVEKRRQQEAQTKLARRDRYGKASSAGQQMPKIVANQRKSNAQVSAGKLRDQISTRVDLASRMVDEMADHVRDASQIQIDLPDPAVPQSRRLLRLWDAQENTYLLQGPERVALVGRNGVGKTRLIEQLISVDQTKTGTTGINGQLYTDRIGYLPQRLDALPDELSIFETVRQQAPAARPQEIRANLARFLFRGDIINRPMAALSGGERFRVALAQLLLAQPPNQLLILDEPTNNLDLRSIEELLNALSDYRGGLLVVSHDQSFLCRLGIKAHIRLKQGINGEHTLQVEQQVV